MQGGRAARVAANNELTRKLLILITKKVLKNPAFEPKMTVGAAFAPSAQSYPHSYAQFSCTNRG